MLNKLRLFITFAALLSSCGPSDQQPSPAHEFEALRGSIPQIGPEVMIGVSDAHPTRIAFPVPVFDVFAAPTLPLKIQKNESQLTVIAEPGLTADGEPVRVHTIDGKQYRLRITLDRSADPNRKIVNVDGAQGVAAKDGGTGLIPPPSEAEVQKFLSFLRRQNVPEGLAPSNTSDYQYLPWLSGKLYLHTTELHATVRKGFGRGGLLGLVLFVENMRAGPVVLERSAFENSRLRVVEFEKRELAAAPLPVLGVKASGNTTVAFLVTERRD